MSDVLTDCEELGPLLRDFGRGRLLLADRERVERHLATCAACRTLADEERALDARFDAELVQRSAPLALKRRLAARLPATSPPPSRRWVAVVAVSAALALILAVIWRPKTAERSPLIVEAVADHLRVVYRDHPVDIESGGPHQVKPWFTGRVDFALPAIFGGDDEFTLLGGSVGYYLDRKAAVLVYKKQLHTISLLMFRADGLSFPRAERDLGRVAARIDHERGFATVLWRDGELGFCLVSDLNADDLQKLAQRISRQ